MNVRLATDADLEAMGSRSVSRGCFGQIPDVTDEYYVLEHDGELLAVGGVKQMNPTCAWVWLDLAAHALENKIALFRIIRKYIEYLMRDTGLTRLMAAVEEDFPEALRLAAHLGFHKESTMRNWIHGKDAFMMVRLAGDGAQEIV